MLFLFALSVPGHDAVTIESNVTALCDSSSALGGAMSKRLLPFGDGHASERIHALTLAALRGKATNLLDRRDSG